MRAHPGPALDTPREAYDLPYAFAQPRRVLVVGAGMGNDVAAALRHGAQQVDAVEIDPAILALGSELHPESPYRSPRVRLINEDARAFLGHFLRFRAAAVNHLQGDLKQKDAAGDFEGGERDAKQFEDQAAR